MSFFDDAIPDGARPSERTAQDQLTEVIPVIRLPIGPTEPGRHSNRADASARRHARSKGPTQRRRRRRGHSMLWRITTTATAFCVLLVMAAGGVTGMAYRKYNGQITRKAVLQPHDPNIRDAARQQKAQNFLVIGSDTRAGADARFGTTEGARSDTTMLVHLSPDRTKATIISIPRDAWVDIPACGASPEHLDMFNSAFAVGGPVCTIKAVQKLTGIAVTHFLEIDFSGFESMVSAMGSVTVCSPQAVDDPYSGLKLVTGQNRLNGSQALAYVRARETLGDGSDLGRIKRQQAFLGAVLRQAMNGSLLTNPARLTSFLDAATKAITVDKGTSFGDLRTLASSLQGLDPKRVTFYTAPIADQNYTPPGTEMTGRVLLDTVQGRVLYDSVINDKKPVFVTTVGGKSKLAPAKGSVGARTSATPAPKAALNASQPTCSL